jgi:cytidylate kinase
MGQFSRQQLKIIGIAGTNGSGKDSLGLALQEHFGYFFISVTDLLRDEARRRGQEVSRVTLRTISAEWRREQGGGVLVDKAIEAWHTIRPDANGVVMASLRNPMEADRVHELNGIVIWLDADAHTRYKRVQANVINRDRKTEDEVTFEEFMKAEEAEMHRSGDEATLDMAAVKEKADCELLNDYPDVNSFVNFVAKELNL